MLVDTVLSAFAATDTTSDAAMQRTLMHAFFQNIPSSIKEKIVNRAHSDDFCSGWRGLQCIDGILTSIEYRNRVYDNFRVDYVPSTVEALIIQECDQFYALHADLFPWRAQVIDFSYNHIFGSIKLTRLPPGLRELRLQGNKITGTLNLMHLPESLEEINLNNNKIEQRVLYVGHFASQMRAIRLQYNAIAHIRCVSKTERAWARMVVQCQNARYD